MRPVTISASGSPVASNVYAVNTSITPTNLGLAAIVTGTITYKVQYTFDDVYSTSFSPSTANWFDHPTLTGSASANSNIAYPVTGVRVTTSAGTGSVSLTIVQGGGGVS